MKSTVSSLKPYFLKKHRQEQRIIFVQKGLTARAGNILSQHMED
jgi:hypothetical protein